MIGMADEVDEVDEIVKAWRRERFRSRRRATPDPVAGQAGSQDVLDDRRAAAFVDHGASGPRVRRSCALRRSGEPFELTAGELCTATHVTSGTMTSRLDRLVARKLVLRRADEDDGRLVLVRLTAAGRRRVDGALTALLHSERELLAKLTLAKRDRLAATLRELLGAATRT